MIRRYPSEGRASAASAAAFTINPSKTRFPSTAATVEERTVAEVVAEDGNGGAARHARSFIWLINGVQTEYTPMGRDAEAVARGRW